jgi:hypothetical protein
MGRKELAAAKQIGGTGDGPGATGCGYLLNTRHGRCRAEALRSGP